MPAGVTVSKVQLYYSVSTPSWQNRNWIPITANFVSENRYTVSLPSNIVSQEADYFAYVKDSRNVVTSSYMYNTMDFSVDINQTDMPVFSLYPNPSNGIFNILINGDKTDNYDFILYDIKGRKIFEERDQSSGNFSINRPTLLSGIYTLNIFSDSDFYSEKVIIY